MATTLHRLLSPFSNKATKLAHRPARLNYAFTCCAASNDPLLNAALHSTFIRFQESLRPDPLVIDPYAYGLLDHAISCQDTLEKSSVSLRTSSSWCYSLAVKFIEDNLVKLMGERDELRQVVLLTDGMDTRPYRMKWPTSTVIYEISPKRISEIALQRLKSMGAKLSKNCRLVPVPLESSDLQATLWDKGFDGNKLSLWVLQGLPMPALTDFEDILSIASSSAMKGSIFIGQSDTSFLVSDPEKDWRKHIENLFVRYGFRVHLVGYDEVARNMHLSVPFEDFESVLFIAEQSRLSDSQMDLWKQHLQRIEDEGDEDGFEEL